MIGGQHYCTVLSSQTAEEVTHGRMAQPTLCDASVGCLVAGKFPYHKAFCTSVAEHVYEVDDHDIQVVIPQLRYLLDELLCGIRVVNLVIRERVPAAIAFELCLDQRLLVEVLALFAVLVHPKLREHLGDIVGHEAAEDSIAGILRRSRQDAAV